MLEITITEPELYDEVNEMFLPTKVHTIRLEHSLVSMSKWESKWRKPFLSKNDKSTEETMDYIKCMTITQNVDPKIYDYISSREIKQITEYINSPQTATTFSDKNGKPSREIITSEIVYYWMIALNIPFECQKWHLNRLLTLIKVCSIKNTPPKKSNKADTLSRYAALNKARKNKMQSKG